MNKELVVKAGLNVVYARDELENALNEFLNSDEKSRQEWEWLIKLNVLFEEISKISGEMSMAIRHDIQK